LVGAV